MPGEDQRESIELRVLVDNFSVENEEQVELLFDNFDASAARICDSTVVTLTVDIAPPFERSLVQSVSGSLRLLEEAVGLRVIDLDLDLVDEGEIAMRAGVTRQSVNLLANHRRAEGSPFPPPYSTPGGRRVWTWASIVRWVRECGKDWNLAAEPGQLSREEQRLISAWIATRQHQPAGSPWFDAPALRSYDAEPWSAVSRMLTKSLHAKFHDASITAVLDVSWNLHSEGPGSVGFSDYVTIRDSGAATTPVVSGR